MFHRAQARITEARLLPTRSESPHFKHDALNVGEFLRALDLRVGGEDLLDERGSGAWQPDNENRIRVRHADAPARGEELRRAHLDLLPRVRFGDVRVVAAF